jgi:hypothetical protein
MMDRRLFLKLTGLTGLVGAAGALDVIPAAAQSGPPLTMQMQSPGTYQITGRVRLEHPLVEISGITNAQQISWSDVGTSRPPTAGFTTFEHFDKPWSMPEIQVRGGRLEALAVVPIDMV